MPLDTMLFPEAFVRYKDRYEPEENGLALYVLH